MSQLKILTKREITIFNGVPKLTQIERETYFLSDPKTRNIINSIRKDENKVGFLVQSAYFAAKGRFFGVDKFKKVDITAAARSLGISHSINLNDYKTQTQARHKQQILKLFGWKKLSNEGKKLLTNHALLQVDKQISSRDILFSLLDFCWQLKSEVPSYNQLAEIVGSSFRDYERNIITRLQESITPLQKQVLKELLENKHFGDSFTKLKIVDQSDRYKSLSKNAQILELFKNNYFILEPLIENLELTPEAIKHFSNWIYKSDLNQIKSIKNKARLYLHLVAFVIDQFYLRQDYAVDALLKVIRKRVNQAKSFDRKEKDKADNKLLEANKAVVDTTKNHLQVMRLILEITNNTSLSLFERNEKVKHLVECYLETEAPALDIHLKSIETNILNLEYKTNFYQDLFNSSLSLQKSLSSLAKAIVFDADNSNPLILEAIHYFKDKTILINEKTPSDFLNKKDKSLLYKDDGIAKVSKYKLLLFLYIEKAIRNRTLTLKYSYRYKHNRSYLISDNEWDSNKERLMEAAGLLKYKNGSKILDDLGKKLTETYEQVNRKYLEGGNTFLTVKRDGKWKLKKSPKDFDSSKYIPQILSNSKFKLLYELLAEINFYTNFTDNFKHLSNKNTAKEPDQKLIYAAIMSLGTNIGHTNLSKATKGITLKNLRDVDRLWLSTKNVLKANENIVKLIQSLNLPTIFNDKNDEIHTSSDGKKVVVAVKSLLANYSYKYYGKEQGISVNSFIDEKQSFFHVNVLTSSDREAPYMMDGIVKTKSTLFYEADKKHTHSTDTHGYTEAIFAGMHLLDVSFAPRIANVENQTIYAYEAKSLRKNTKNPIAPNTLINRKKILQNWDDVLRFMTTIKLGRCSASHLFKILSSSQQNSELYVALKEFGRLIKSNFILNYLDDESLRKSIQKQLNRAELGQKLSNAIFFARTRQLYAGTESELQKIMACKTLLKNAIILWNYLFLSDYYNSLENDIERGEVIDSISKGSVISWEHINMGGFYDFDLQFEPSFNSTLKQMKNIRIQKTTR